MEALSRRGWLEEALIVLWSDHGELAGDHGRFYKSVFYESSVRVPLIVRWPGELPGGVVRPHLAQTVDVFDTLLEATGCEPSRRSFGRSLLPAGRDAHAPLREAAFSEIAFGPVGRTTMVRTDGYKYAVNESAQPLMLFDLTDDPLEQTNLAGDSRYASLRSDLDRRIYEWLLATQLCQ